MACSHAQHGTPTAPAPGLWAPSLRGCGITYMSCMAALVLVSGPRIVWLLQARSYTGNAGVIAGRGTLVYLCSWFS
jgi:hypothetical protein